MSEHDEASSVIEAAMRFRQAVDTQPLHKGGGGGTSGGMEERVTRLEKNVDTLTTGFADLRVDIARLQVKVDHLPSKGFVVTATSATIVLITAAITFGDKLQALVGS